MPIWARCLASGWHTHTLVSATGSHKLDLGLLFFRWCAHGRGIHSADHLRNFCKPKPRVMSWFCIFIQRCSSRPFFVHILSLAQQFDVLVVTFLVANSDSSNGPTTTNKWTCFNVLLFHRFCILFSFFLYSVSSHNPLRPNTTRPKLRVAHAPSEYS